MMNISKVNKGEGAIDVPPNGAFGWATVYEYSASEGKGVKWAALDEATGEVYTGTSSEGIKKYHAVTGRTEKFLGANEFSDPIHTLCVLGRTLWICTGNNSSAGTVVIYDLDTAVIKTRPFAAHKGEVTCMAAGPGHKYMITGGVDFQVKFWSPDGTLLHTSNHHNKQVESILVTPLSAGGSTDAGGKIWTCSADGTICHWSDEKCTGLFDANPAKGGKSIAVPGSKPVKSLARHGDNVWAGCEGGQICVYALETASLVTSLKAHTDTVDTLAAVGDQMWSASRDKSIVAHDAAAYTTTLTLGDQGGGVKQMFCYKWFVWTFTMKGVRVFTSESIWRQQVEETKRHIKEHQVTREELSRQLAAEKKKSHDLGVQLKEQKGELARLKEDLGKGKGTEGRLSEVEGKLSEAEERVRELEAALEASEAAAAEKLREARAAAEEAVEQLRLAQEGEARAKAAARLATMTVAELEAEKERLEQLVSDLREQHEGLEVTNKSLDGKLSGAEEELAQVRARLAAEEEAAGKLRAAQEEEVRTKAGNQEELSRQLAELRAENERVVKEGVAQSASLKALQAQLNAHKSLHDDCEEALKKTIEDLKLRDADLAKVKSSHEASKKDLDARSRELDELRRKLEEANNRAKSLEVEEKKVSASRSAESAEKASLAARLADLEAQLAALAKEKEMLAGRAKAMEGSKQALHEEVRNLLEQVKELEASKETLGARLSAGEANREALLSKLRGYEDDGRGQDEKARELQQAADEAERRLRAVSEERDSLEKALKVTKEALELSESKLRNVAVDREGIEARVKSLAVQLEESERRLEQQTHRYNDLEHRLKDSERRAADEGRRATQAESQALQLNMELGAIRVERDVLKREVDRSEKSRDRVQEEMDRLRSRVTDVESRMHSAPSPMMHTPPPASSPNIIVNIPGLGGSQMGSPGANGGLGGSVVMQEGMLHAAPSPPWAGARSSDGDHAAIGDQERALYKKKLNDLSTRNQELEASTVDMESLKRQLEEAKAKAEPGSRSPPDTAGNDQDDKGAKEGGLKPEDSTMSAAAATTVPVEVHEEAVRKLQEELDEALEDKYQLQLALRSALKEVDLLKGMIDMLHEEQAAREQEGATEDREKMQQLEAALKQAVADYQHLLDEVSKVQEERLTDYQQQLEIKQQEAEMYKLEVDRLNGEVANLQARVEDLGEQLRLSEANYKKMSFLEGTHNSIKRRLSEAKKNDGRYNFASHPSPPSEERPEWQRPFSGDGGRGRRFPFEKMRPLPPGGFM